MAVLVIGTLLVAGLVVWALTRTVQPVPETASLPPAATATAPVGVEPTGTAIPNPALPVPETTVGAQGEQTSTYAPNPPTADENASVARVSVADLKAQIDSKQVTVIDVRDQVAFATSHIPGAINVPMASVESNVATLPKDKPIVTYCT